MRFDSGKEVVQVACGYAHSIALCSTKEVYVWGSGFKGKRAPPQAPPQPSIHSLPQPGPHLVVAPLSVLGAWAAECRKWCPSLRVVRFHSSDKRERERLVAEDLADVSTFDIVLTTYDVLLAPGMGKRYRRGHFILSVFSCVYLPSNFPFISMLILIFLSFRLQ